MQLCRTYPAERVDAACRRALDIRALSYRSVKSILATGLDHDDSATQFITNLKSDGTFLESVAGDTQELFCDDTSRCTDDGTWHVMGTRFFICDPGCDDENFQYTISGNTGVCPV